MYSKKEKHVLMVLESLFPTKGGGGAEKQVQTLCKHLPKFVSSTIIVPRVQEGSSSVDDVVDGIPVIRIAYPYIPFFGALLMLIKLAWYIFINRKKIDAIHCHIAHNMAAVCCAVGSLLNIPVLVKLTGWLELEYGILSKRKTPLVKLKRFLIKKATVIQSTSHDMEKALLNFNFDRQKVKFIPNSVDIERYKPDPDNKDILKNKLNINGDYIVSFIGRLVPEKSLDTLLLAWGKAIPKSDSAQLLIIGDGSLRDELEALSRKLGISQQVVFVGATNHVSEYLKISDVGVLPSEFEGLSNALLESMSSGLPVIGSKISGTVDMIEHGVSGWLFRPRDVDELAKNLKLAYDCPCSDRSKMGQAARDKIINYAGIDHILSKLLDSYGI